jgi:ribosome-associated toxin RatA of RatAB toxin-antitoxin module
MPQVRRSALLPYSALQVFELVNDVERYPEFLPWCGGAKIVASTAHQIDAQLTIIKGRLRECFTTRNIASAPDSIQMSLVDGPFRRLEGSWRFTSLSVEGGATGCKVELELEFEMAKSLLQKTLGGLFAHATGTMVDAFCVRARTVYGTPA